LGLVFIGLLGWLASTYLMGDETITPIAVLDPPDFHSILIVPQDPDHILFGSHTGIQESHDGGVTWEDGALRNVDAMQLTVSLDDPETIYVTGHDVFQVSRDGGQTWRPQVHDLPDTDIHGFTQDLDNSQRLYAYLPTEPLPLRMAVLPGARFRISQRVVACLLPEGMCSTAHQVPVSFQVAIVE
jgi:hypothetical protein